jgi:hypothetical protein
MIRIKMTPDGTPCGHDEVPDGTAFLREPVGGKAWYIPALVEYAGEGPVLDGPVYDVVAGVIRYTRKAAPPPVLVTPWRARLALNASGQRAAIEAWIATQSQDVRDGWEYATEIRRDHPMIAAAVAAGVMTETQVDELFALAATL